MNDAIVLPIDIGVGKEREVQTLLADPWRKLVLIRLRHSALLADHSARVPITIHALLGQGTLNVTGRAYPLAPGVIVPVDAHTVHSVQAEPELAILVTFFRQPETAIGDETTARFGGC
jgi:quercetin dioxygenase-like cupin family protein